MQKSQMEPDSRIRTYLRAFFARWLTGMSGSLSVPFAALAIFEQSVSQKIVWGLLAVSSATIASYGVWREERLTAFKREQALLSRIEQLEQKPYDEAQRKIVEENLKKWSVAERDLLRFLLLRGKSSFLQLVMAGGSAIETELNGALATLQLSGFVNAVAQTYEIAPRFEAALKDALFPRNETEQPKLSDI
jgi:hypothetical protein